MISRILAIFRLALHSNSHAGPTHYAQPHPKSKTDCQNGLDYASGATEWARNMNRRPASRATSRVGNRPASRSCGTSSFAAAAAGMYHGQHSSASHDFDVSYRATQFNTQSRAGAGGGGGEGGGYSNKPPSRAGGPYSQQPHMKDPSFAASRVRSARGLPAPLTNSTTLRQGPGVAAAHSKASYENVSSSQHAAGPPIVATDDVAALFRAVEASSLLHDDRLGSPRPVSGRARAWGTGPAVFENDGRPGTRGGGTAYDLEGRPLTRGGARPPSRMQATGMLTSSAWHGAFEEPWGGTSAVPHSSFASMGATGRPITSSHVPHAYPGGLSGQAQRPPTSQTTAGVSGSTDRPLTQQRQQEQQRRQQLSSAGGSSRRLQPLSGAASGAGTGSLPPRGASRGGPPAPSHAHAHASATQGMVDGHGSMARGGAATSPGHGAQGPPRSRPPALGRSSLVNIFKVRSAYCRWFRCASDLHHSVTTSLSLIRSPVSCPSLPYRVHLPHTVHLALLHCAHLTLTHYRPSHFRWMRRWTSTPLLLH